jgi:phytoene synthase
MSASSVSEAYALCRRVAHRYGPNFSVGFRFLPQPKRNAVYAAYAFCRYVDDVVDENPGTDVREGLDRWEAELDRCYAGSPTHPIAVALADAAARYPIPKESFAGLIEGCRMDLVKNRYASYEELLVYSDLVATTISTMSLSIFGYRNPEAIDRGRDLATAFQLTNILRDVGEDTHKNRIYLPQDEMSRFGVLESDLMEKKMTSGFVELMRFQVQRGKNLYHRAEPLLGMIESDTRRCTCLMGAVYYRVLQKIEKRDYNIFAGRVSLSLPSKLGLVARTYLSPKPTWSRRTV